MLSTTFRLEKPGRFSGDEYNPIAHYYVPTLVAYAIEYAELKVYPNMDGIGKTELLSDVDFYINDVWVEWPGFTQWIPGTEIPITLIIHYHGIRNHEFLFPQVKKDGRETRLGLFYAEAEKNFESNAWLSFALMCGAVFEGLLFDVINDTSKTLNELTKLAYKKQIINRDEKNIIDSVRYLRNLVHLNTFKNDYVLREKAMDVRKTLDDMIKRFSYF